MNVFLLVFRKPGKAFMFFMCFMVSGSWGAAQQFRVTQTPASGTALILGQIVDADTGKGIAGALVVLSLPIAPPTPVGELTEMRPPAMPAPAAPGARRVLAAPDGRFVFRDLPAGHYSVSASATTHVPGAYGQLRVQGPTQSLDLAENEKLGGVTVRLWRFAAISGMVRDENGEPVAGANVECFRRVFTGGQKRFASLLAGSFTDDRGVYRMASLVPGDYICGNVVNPSTVPLSVSSAAAASDPASPSEAMRRITNSSGSYTALGTLVGGVTYSNGTGSLRGPQPPPPDGNGRIMAYAPQYVGGATTTAQASVISVKAGEDRTGADLQLRLVPTVRISGRLNGPDGPVGFLGLTLVPANGGNIVSEGQAAYARTTSDANGAFTLLGIPSGEYVLKGRYYPRPAPGGNPAVSLEETTLWIAAPITAAGSDLTNLALTVRAGIRVSGRVDFVGARQPTPAELQRVGIRMQMAEGRTSSPIALDGRTLADGTFRTAGYPAGKYIANVLPNTVPAGWFVKSIVANGRDISVEPVELSGADLAGVVVTLTDKTTTLTGTVSTPTGPDPTAEVVVFPADSMAWKEIGVVARRSRVERVSKTGAFSMAGLPPGEYYVAAAAGSLPGDRQDPAWLTVLMRTASTVTLAEGGSATVTLAVAR
ncbi:MAG TPA: carboxypeptidase-like regulatory domain-containing protein [Vicinamibacterales bacterium]|nr:carboxypeptidase-like regulatory domain-containing protein [Vicinamibacterales bacterium]